MAEAYRSGTFSYFLYLFHALSCYEIKIKKYVYWAYLLGLFITVGIDILVNNFDIN